MNKVLIYIVAYSAAKHIEQLLERIPKGYLNQENVTILVADDASEDNTIAVAENYAKQHHFPLVVHRHPSNLGYGGNQKFGYHYAIEHGFEIVVLLHGDGQYAPEYLASMISPISDGTADVVLGSRMINKRRALQGGMPLYKWLGNIFLTAIQNTLLNTKLHEFHTGYRAFRVSSLQCIPFAKNSDDFVFDTEILIQMIDRNQTISELEIPTFYGDEISHVKCIKYGTQVLGKTIAYKMHQWGWADVAQFDKQ